MNRIKISPLATAANDSENNQTEALVDPLGDQVVNQIDKLICPSGNEWSVFMPMHLVKSYRYPLIVWLHSDGDDRSQLQRVMPETSLRNYIGVATDGPVGDQHRGYFWDQCDESVRRAGEAVCAAVDHVSLEHNVATDRIFLAGFGNGGTMAFRLAFERPDLFAGVVSLNGPMPKSSRPLRRWQQCRNLPVFWAHCRNSIQFGEADLCEQLRLLHIAGFSVTLRQYPGGDQGTPPALADMNRWIMEQIDTAIH